MMDFVDLVVNPQFMVMALAAISAFATVLTIALPILSRDRTSQRMKVMAVERDRMRAQRLAEMSRDRERSGLMRQQAPKGYMRQLVDQLQLQTRFDTEEIRAKLKMAGLRGEAPLITYMFFRVVLPPVLFLVALFYVFVVLKLSYPPLVKVGIALVVGLLGYYLPNLFVENMVQKRQQAIKLAFPDALDMLLICVQSGMSIEAAFGKVASEISGTSLELAEELSLTTAELSYLGERRLAFENFGKRTGVPGVKAVCTALIQAERYGTPVSQALRVMAKENREMRMAEAEKKAASLPPKLTVPMILFFLPVLFLVILGPAAITLWWSPK